jgi:hypothetical protein
MDPYLESPDIWPDFHDGLAGEIRNALNSTLPPSYYARLEMRPEIGVVEDDEEYARRIVPDIAVVSNPRTTRGPGGVAVADAPRQAISENFFTLTVYEEPFRHAFVEIRDPSRGHKLVTLIEIVSPSNKREGPDRRAYLQKKKQVLLSDANLIEIDLLREGDRPLGNPYLEEKISRIAPAPDYLVLVNRAWPRTDKAIDYQIFHAYLPEMLPCIPVPLRRELDEVPLDLQYVFNRAYDGGPYRRGAVDYGNPPNPPLTGEWAAWAQQRIQDSRTKSVAP